MSASIMSFTLRECVKKALPGPLRRALSGARAAARRLPRVFGPRFVPCEVRGLSIRVSVGTDIEQVRADTYATKEPDTLDWLDGELRPEDVFYDVGANIGLYSLYAAARSSGCRVYAFEPEAQNFAALCRNVHRNDLPNVVPCPVALSDKEGFDVLCVSRVESGNAFHGVGAPSPFRLGGAAVAFRQGVICASIDRLVEECGVPSPTLLKLDVDGTEGMILRGAERLLRVGKLRSILVEINGDGGDILAFLRGCGYEPVSRGPGTVTGTGEMSFNCVLRHR